MMGLVYFNQYYSSIDVNSGGPLSNVLGSLQFAKLFPPQLYFSVPLILLSFTGITLALAKKKPLPWILLIGLAIGTQVEVALPGHFYPHYYQLWFPFLIIGSAWGLASLEVFRVLSRPATHAAAIVVLVILAAIEAPDYFSKSANEWSRQKYGDIFIKGEEVAKLINSVLLPNETFYQLGSETQLYVIAGRKCPSVGVDYYMSAGPMAERMTKLLFEDFSKAPPDLFILYRWSEIRESHPVYEWVRINYVPAPRIMNPDPFFLFVRKGSELEKRLTAAAR